jgi:hypothetical protein
MVLECSVVSQRSVGEINSNLDNLILTRGKGGVDGFGV